MGCGQASMAPCAPAVLQMAFCAGRPRRVLPEAVSSRNTQVLPPRLSRVNGWSRPLHYFQIMAWTVFLILVLSCFSHVQLFETL